LIEANNNISDYRYRKQKKNDKKKSRNFPDELKNREKSFISKIQIYYKEKKVRKNHRKIFLETNLFCIHKKNINHSPLYDDDGSF